RCFGGGPPRAAGPGPRPRRGRGAPHDRRPDAGVAEARPRGLRDRERRHDRGARAQGGGGMAGAGAEGRRIRIDMHIHTRGSYDCLSDPDAVVERAAARGIDRVCITDHNEIEVALRLKERYPERVIVGEEVKTAEGVDVIGLYVSERIPKGT